MDTVILHIEYLLRHHDCVVLPGWGAFIARRVTASFRSEGHYVMTPPARSIAFNAELREDDGLLLSSVCRRENMTYSEATHYVRSQVCYLSEILREDGEVVFGHLGKFSVCDNMPLRFFPAPDAVNYMNLGLEIITPEPLEIHRPGVSAAEPVPAVSSPLASAGVLRQVGENIASERSVPACTPDVVEVECGSEKYKESFIERLRRNAVGIAATVAILLTAGLFFYNPISLDNEPAKASIAPSVSDTGARDSKRDSQPGVSAEEKCAAPGHDIEGDDVYVPGETMEGNSVHTPHDGELPAGVSRFDSSDPYCVVIASFPDGETATRYVSSLPDCRLGIMSDGDRYCVYQATALTCADAYAQKELLGNSRAWVCMMN